MGSNHSSTHGSSPSNYQGNRRKSHLLEYGFFHDPLHPGRKSPKPFEPGEEETTDGMISPKLFHNYFYDGFYAPFILNPVYMLLVDCRDEDAYDRSHVATAHWYGGLDLDDPELDLTRFSLIILYDVDGSAEEGTAIRKLQDALSGMKVKLEPVIVHGGFEMILKKYPYMVTKLELKSEERPSYIHWYPSVIRDSTLYLGRAEHALDEEVIESLNITHIVNLTSDTPNVFPSVSYLCFPVTPDSKDSTLLHYFAQIAKRIEDAINAGGRVLVHCDQGINASATVVISYLMHENSCTLEDAHYYVKSLRPIIQPTEHYLEELSEFENELFGRKITNIDDLWF